MTVMDDVIADYLGGLSARACGKKHGIAAHTVLSNLRARGITPRSAPTAILTGQNLQRALKLRAEGWSYDALGREFGLSHTAVRTALLGYQDGSSGS